MEKPFQKTGMKPEENAKEQQGNKNEVSVEKEVMNSLDGPNEATLHAEGQQPNEAALHAEGQQPNEAALHAEGQQPNGAALHAEGQQPNEAALHAEGQQPNEAALLKGLIEQVAQGASKIHIEITHIDSVSGDYVKCYDPDQLRRRNLKAEREELSHLTRDEARLFARLKDLEVMRGCISYVGLAYSADDLSDLIVAFCERYRVSTSCHDLWTRELIHVLRPFCVHIVQDFKAENVCRSLKNKFGGAGAPSFDSLPD